MNIYASEYAQKVLDFNRIVVARGPDGWMIRGGDALRELRVPASLGVPDVAASRGIAGYQPRANDYYVHLAEADAVLQLAPQVPTQPYLVEANGRIMGWRQERSTLQFGLQALRAAAFHAGERLRLPRRRRRQAADRRGTRRYHPV